MKEGMRNSFKLDSETESIAAGSICKINEERIYVEMKNGRDYEDRVKGYTYSFWFKKKKRRDLKDQKEEIEKVAVD